MKKRTIGLGRLALATAMLFAGGAQAAPEIINANAPVEQQAPTQQKQELPKQTAENRKQILPDGTGGLMFQHPDHGISPKDYGQYLQSTGRQKWSKKR